MNSKQRRVARRLKKNAVKVLHKTLAQFRDELGHVSVECVERALYSLRRKGYEFSLTANENGSVSITS